MNKFAFLLGLLLIFNLSKSEDNDQKNEPYARIISILEGMSETGEGQCVAVLRNNKPQILDLITNIMTKIKNGEEIISILNNTEQFSIDGLYQKCNINGLSEALALFNSETGITYIGSKIVDNADEIFSYIQEFKAKETLDEKMISVGNILSIIFNFYVN